MYINCKRRKRKRKTKDGFEVYQEETYTAIIRFGKNHEFSRNTGKTTRREAEQWAKAEAKRIELNELQKRIVTNITVDQLLSIWWIQYARKQFSSETMSIRAKQIHAILGGDTLVRDIDDDTIADLVVDLYESGKKGKSASTVNRCVDVLKAALREGKKFKEWRDKRDQFNEIEWSDHRQREPKERDVFISPEQARQLVNQMADTPHIALAVAWSIYTGCRRNETRTLTWDKIYPDAHYCTVQAKGGNPRHVILSDKAKMVLGALPEPDRKTGLVFDLTNRRKIWEAARDAMGMPDLRWHDLRHVAGTWLRQYGKIDLKATGRALGHTNIETTDRYSHVADSELQSALDAMPDFTSDLSMQISKQQGGAIGGCQET